MPPKKQTTEQHSKQLIYWSTHPLEWAKAMFGDNIKKSPLSSKLTETGLSLQQEGVLRLWGEFLEAKLLRSYDKPLTERQAELASKIGLSVMSGTGTGKDTTAAIITWHFMYCFHYPKCLATANTGKQLKDVFWSELSKVQSWAVSSAPDDPDCLNELQHAFTVQSELLFANIPVNRGRGSRWFCRAVTINTKASPEEQGEALAGRHEDYQLFVLDEASGIPDAVFKPVEGTLTGILNVVFMIFNPTRTTGFAVRSHYEEKDKWVCVRWNSEESEIVKPAHIENLARYGKDSPTYRARVLGLPPHADKNTLIPMDWVMNAVEKYRNKEIVPLDCDPLILGADIGGGGDKSVARGRKGGLVFPARYNNSKDSTVVEDWLVSESVRLGANGIVPDIIGIGHGVYWRLRKRGLNVRPGDARRSARDADRFKNARAEAAMRLREAFEKGVIAVPDEPDLIEQLSAMKFFPEDGNKLPLKSEIIRDLGHSPDDFDSLLLTYYYPDDVFDIGSDQSQKLGKEFLKLFQR